MHDSISSFVAVPVSMLLPFAAGVGAGNLYFGGLWLTVQRLGKGGRPGILLIPSFLVRASLSCAVFYLFMRSGWADLVACMLGFFLVRLLWVHRLRPTPAAAARGRKAD